MPKYTKKSGGLTKAGIALYAETNEYVANINRAMSSNKTLNEVLGVTVGHFPKLTKVVADSTKAIAENTKVKQDSTKSSQAMGESLFSTVVKANLATNAIMSLTNSVVGFVREATDISGKLASFMMFATNLDDSNERIIESATGVQGAWASLGNEAIQAAGRIDQLDFVLKRIGAQHGLTGESIDEEIAKIKKLGITTSEAQNTVLQFIQSNIDLSKAAELARIAQDAAVISNSDSSTTLQRLMHGIVTGQTEVIRYAGIQIDGLDQLKKVTGELGEEAKDASRQERILNAIMEKGKDIAGAYEASLESANKKLGSLKRYQIELVRVLGEPFQKFYLEFVDARTAFTKGMYAMFEEGGMLRPILETLGDLMAKWWEKIKGVANAFKDFVTIPERIEKLKESFKSAGKEAGTFEQYIKDAIGPGTFKLFQSISEAISRIGESFRTVYDAFMNSFGRVFEVLGQYQDEAFEWGANFVQSLADGIEAAAGYVTAAIGVVGDVFTYWMQPGSPPRFLPYLEKWGAKAASVYAESWKLDDFSVFKNMASSVNSILDVMASSGMIKSEKMIPMFWNLREQLASLTSTFQETGKISEDVLGNIAKMGGKAGEEMSGLARMYLQQYSITKKMKDIQDALTKATEKYDQKLKTSVEELSLVQKEKSAIQRRLERGRGSLADTAKLLKLQAREAELTKTITDTQKEKEAVTEAAQTQLKQLNSEQQAVSEQIQVRQEMIRLWSEENSLIEKQQKLLDQLARQALGKAVPEAVDKKSLIQLDIEAKAAEIKKQMEDFFANIFKSIEESAIGRFIQGVINGLDGLKGHFQSVTDVIKRVWKNFTKAFDRSLRNLQASIESLFKGKVDWEKWGKLIGDILTGLALIIGGVLVGAITIALGFINGFVNGMAKIIARFQFWKDKISEFINDAIAAFQKGDLLAVLNNIGLAIGSILIAPFDIALQGVWGFVQGVLNYIGQLYTDLTGNEFPGIEEAFSNWADDTIKLIIGLFVDLFSGLADLWEAFKKKLAQLWDEINAKVQETIDAVLLKLGEFVTFISMTLTNTINWFKTNVLQPLIDKFNNVKKAVAELISKFGDLVNTLRSSAENGLKKAFEWLQTNILQPFIDFMFGEKGPINTIKALITEFGNVVKAIGEGSLLKTAWDTLQGYVNSAKTGLEGFITALQGFVTAVMNLDVTAIVDIIKQIFGWFIHSSPSPIEEGMMGAIKLMHQLTNIQLPRLSIGDDLANAVDTMKQLGNVKLQEMIMSVDLPQLSVANNQRGNVYPPMSGDSITRQAYYQNSTQNNYNLNMTTVTPAHNVIRDFNMMKALA